MRCVEKEAITSTVGEHESAIMRFLERDGKTGVFCEGVKDEWEETAAGPRDRDISGGAELFLWVSSGPCQANQASQELHLQGGPVVASCGQPALAGTCTVGVGRTSRAQAHLVSN